MHIRYSIVLWDILDDIEFDDGERLYDIEYDGPSVMDCLERAGKRGASMEEGLADYEDALMRYRITEKTFHYYLGESKVTANLIIISVSFIEAYLGEVIWAFPDIDSQQKRPMLRMRINDKLAEVFRVIGGIEIEKQDDPFYSFKALTLLRNRFVHYEGHDRKESLNPVLDAFSSDKLDDIVEWEWERKQIPLILANQTFRDWVISTVTNVVREINKIVHYKELVYDPGSYKFSAQEDWDDWIRDNMPVDNSNGRA